MQEVSLYIHIPFCERKCNYCAFVSYCASSDKIDEYVENLCKEIERRKTNQIVKTIYIGGGTPSILTGSQIEKIVNAIYANFDVYDNAEFTVEANPNTISEEFLKTLKKLRVNRISIGVQTLNDKGLKKIGRLHDKKMAIEKIKLARRYFDNVSADLIVGLENENGKDLRRYARELLSLGVKHISCYLLEVYENTPLHQMIERGNYKALSDDETIDAFEKLSSYLVDMGLERYEISNFAYEGYESRHNLNYWQRGDYLGFGIAAHSLVCGKRIENPTTFEDYYSQKTKTETLSKKDEIEEIIMLGLRCKLGVVLSELEKRNYDITKNAYFKDYIMQGILTQDDEKVFLNPLFYHVSNTIISNLLPD